jgi:hypothetical protein
LQPKKENGRDCLALKKVIAHGMHGIPRKDQDSNEFMNLIFLGRAIVLPISSFSVPSVNSVGLHTWISFQNFPLAGSDPLGDGPAHA